MSHFEMVVAVIIGILSVARTARLIVHDAWPPVVALRIAWENRWGREGWSKLIFCQYCVTPWMAAGMALWFYLGGDHWTWWVINGVWGFSYVSAILVSYDGD